MNTLRSVAALMLVSGVALVGCQGDDQVAEPSPTAVATPSPTSVAPGVEPGATVDVGPDLFPAQPADWQTALEIVDGPITFTAGEGITMTVVDAWVSNLPEAPDAVVAEARQWFGDDDDLPVVFSLQITASNATDHDIEWVKWPSLEIVGVPTGGSLAADAWISQGLPRDGLPSGTTSDAHLVYLLPERTAADLVTGDGRLLGNLPFDVDTGESLGDSLDLPFSWQPE
jgi:hypothetical protein